jgi:zinc transporter ZupT
VVFSDRLVRVNLKSLLVFAGAYLFSITIVHLLPELFITSHSSRLLSIVVLLGFFMQIFIDFFTSGVEHGHHHQHAHRHTFSPVTLMVGLCIHGLMDGAILAHSGEEGVHGHQMQQMSLLIGIVLHKVPATIVLLSVLRSFFDSKKVLTVLLLVFSITSPLGLYVSEYLRTVVLFGTPAMLLVFALVCGNFLHISTTIYFEHTPEHAFNRKKIVLSILGALLAVLLEFLHV